MKKAEGDTEEAIENITANCTQSGASKFLRDGQVFILHGGKIYNAFGAEIR